MHFQSKFLALSCFAILSAAQLGHANSLGNVVDKLSCSEAQSIEVKCAEFDKLSAECQTLVQVEAKKKVESAKQEQADCKSRNPGVKFALKCKDQIKKSVTLSNTPEKVLVVSVEKELTAVTDSSCAKADAVAKAQVLCKGPKKAIEVLKTNCIK